MESCDTPDPKPPDISEAPTPVPVGSKRAKVMTQALKTELPTTSSTNVDAPRHQDVETPGEINVSQGVLLYSKVDPPMTQMTTPGTKSKSTNGNASSFSVKKKEDNVMKLRVLHLKQIPLVANYEVLAEAFGSYGTVKEIRMSIQEITSSWEAWITFSNHEIALKATSEIGKIKVCGSDVQGALCELAPTYLDVYTPAEWNPTVLEKEVSCNKRMPKPPMWLVATAKEENYNYYKFSRFLQKKVGGINKGDISRFGKKSVLIHAKSKTQSYLLIHLKVEEHEMLKDIKPHMNFSYGKGVIFDRDLYEFSEEEILSMSPKSVILVKKIPRTKMIILTFEDTTIPSHVDFENERVVVRPFRPRPMQCYKCFRFGHTLRVCKNNKVCEVCSALAHGECSAPAQCTNCSKDHKSSDKNCQQYKNEEAALNKANAEHLSIGYAKKLLSKTKSYAKVAKTAVANNAKRTHLTESVHAPEVAVLPLELGVMPSGNAPSPSSLPSSHEMSQEMSLPDLGEVSSQRQPLHAPAEGMVHGTSSTKSPSSAIRGQKRGDTSSPTSFMPVDITTTNRFDVLASNNSIKSRTKEKPSKKLKVEVHQLPRPESQKKCKPKGAVNRPSISKIPMITSSLNNRLQKEDAAKKSKP